MFSNVSLNFHKGILKILIIFITILHIPTILDYTLEVLIFLFLFYDRGEFRWGFITKLIILSKGNILKIMSWKLFTSFSLSVYFVFQRNITDKRSLALRVESIWMILHCLKRYITVFLFVSILFQTCEWYPWRYLLMHMFFNGLFEYIISVKISMNAKSQVNYEII